MRTLLFLLTTFSLILSSCSSTADGDSEVKEVVEAEVAPSGGAPKNAGEPVADKSCGAPPAPVMCCEAMTPTCNECREKSRRIMEEWRTRCAPKTTNGQKSCGQPPVADCCPGPECKACREEALTKIMAWRKDCGVKGAVNCDEKPSFTQCCSTGQPSCDACRKRITRMLQDFATHCGK